MRRQTYSSTSARREHRGDGRADVGLDHGVVFGGEGVPAAQADHVLRPASAELAGVEVEHTVLEADELVTQVQSRLEALIAHVLVHRALAEQRVLEALIAQLDDDCVHALHDVHEALALRVVRAGDQLALLERRHRRKDPG